MNNLAALRSRILQDSKGFGLEQSIGSHDLEIEVVSPPFDGTRGGRLMYCIYINGAKKPGLIAQSRPIWDKPSLSQNPYRPACPGTRHLKDVLPDPVGVIDNGDRKLFWACYVNGETLDEVLHSSKGAEILERVLCRLERPPWDQLPVPSISKSQEVLSEYLEMLTAVCAVFPELQKTAVQLQNYFRDNWDSLTLGFSHGDLWSENIIYSNRDQICIVDWEMVSDCRPATTDMLDLSLSVIESFYSLKRGESFTCLVAGKGCLEDKLRCHLRKNWASLGYNSVDVRITILGYLLWAQYRLIRQASDQLAQNNRNIGRTLLDCFRNPEFLEQMVS